MFLLVPAYPGSPGQKDVKRLCVCVCVLNVSVFVGSCHQFEVDSSDSCSMTVVSAR